MKENEKEEKELGGALSRSAYLVLGWFFFALGMVGVLLPVVPTTPFMVLAVWAFSRSSRRFEHWILNHKLFGEGVRRFRDHRVVPISVKLTSWISMAITFGVSVATRRIPWWGLLGQALVMGYGAYYIARCPSQIPAPPPPQTPETSDEQSEQ